MVLTEPRASLAEGQLVRKQASMEPGLCFPPSFGFFPGKPGTCAQSPRGLLATPGMQAAKAGRPESSRLVPTCPHPAPPRLVFGSHWNILRRKCQGGVAQLGEMDNYFKG